MFKSKNPLLKNIQIISEAMNWDEKFLLTTGSGYYFTYDNKTEEDVKEIFEKTGIQCSLTENGILLIPEFTNFKSEKEKDLLLRLGQYGSTMMYLDLCKKCNPSDLRILSRELFNKLSKTLSEEEFHSLLENVINKIS